MAKALRNLNVDYRKVLGKMSVGERVDLARSKYAGTILSSLTPAQLADLFPRYYMQSYPDVGKTLKDVGLSGGTTPRPSASTAAPTVGAPGSPGARPSAKPAQQVAKPAWLTKLEEATGIKVSDPGAKAELSREQKEIFEQLKKGAIAADDPRVAFMKDISDADLKKAGIERGEQGYKALPTQTSQLSDEDVKKRTATVGSEPTLENIANYIRTKAVEKGVDPNLALGIARYEGLNRNTINSSTFGNKDRRGYSFGPYQLFSNSPDPTKIVPGGEAYNFLRKHGEPPSAANWQKQVDYGLDIMKQRGPAGLEKGPWYAVRDRGGVAAITKLGAEYARTLPEVTTNNSNLTPEQVQEVRKKLESEEVSQRENTLAGAIASKFKLPEGLDPKFVEDYNRLAPGQKQNVQQALRKIGEGTTDGGVQKLNELYRANPQQVVETASRPSSGENLVEMRNQNATRNLPITTNLNDQLNYAATQAGVKVEVFSGGQERPFMVNGKMTTPRHNAGGAADVKLYVRDEKGNKRYLDMRNPEDANTMKKFTVAAVHAGATGVGAGPGYMGYNSIHIGGGKTASWGAGKGQPAAPWVREALNEGLARRQSQPLNLEDWKKQQQEKRELPNNITQASPEAEKKERENTYERVFGRPPQLTEQREQFQQQQQQAAQQQQQQQAPKRALLAAGTNDYGDEEKAYQGIMRSARALQAQGKDVTLVMPAPNVRGTPHAFNAAQRAARDLGIKTVTPSSFGRGEDHYHMTPNAAAEIRKNHPDAEVYGDSNAVRINPQAEGKTGFTGAPASTIAQQIERQSAPQQGARGTPTSVPTIAPAPQMRVGAPGAPGQQQPLPPSNAPPQMRVGAPGAPGQQQPQPQQQPAPQQKPKQEETEVPAAQAFAEGGEMQTNSPEITAYPIKNIKDDNSLVVDKNNNPLFTMNRDTESVKLNPDGKVEVQPVNRNNPEDIKPVANQTDEQPYPTPNETGQTPIIMTQAGPPPSNYNALQDATKSLTENIFKSPSFERAVAQSRFMKDSDPLGGHFDHGAYNIT